MKLRYACLPRFIGPAWTVLAQDLEARVAVPTRVTSKFHRGLPDILALVQAGEKGSYATICIPELQLYWYTGTKV